MNTALINVFVNMNLDYFFPSLAFLRAIGLIQVTGGDGG
jgi:hypothetical protein